MVCLGAAVVWAVWGTGGGEGDAGVSSNAVALQGVSMCAPLLACVICYHAAFRSLLLSRLYTVFIWHCNTVNTVVNQLFSNTFGLTESMQHYLQCIALLLDVETFFNAPCHRLSVTCKGFSLLLSSLCAQTCIFMYHTEEALLCCSP